MMPVLYKLVNITVYNLLHIQPVTAIQEIRVLDLFPLYIAQ